MSTIYIVDDRDLNRQYLVTLLKYYGHELEEARDGVEVLTQVKRRIPDLIILDIVMPNIDGREVVERLKRAPATATIPVIFYTATYRNMEARAIADTCGVRWVLPKPSEPQLILETVAEALGVEGAATWGEPVEIPQSAEGDTRERWDLEKRMIALTNSALYRGDLSGEPGAESSGANDEQLIQMQAMTLKLVALLELSNAISVREPGRLVDLFCRAAQDILTARYAAVGILNEDGSGFRYFEMKGDGAAAQAWPWPMPPSGALGRALVERRPVCINHLKGDLCQAGLPAGHPPIDSILVVPLFTNKRSYGWLYGADRLGCAGFSMDDERIAATIGSQLAVAFENIVLGEEQKIHAARLKRELEERRMIEAALVASEERLSFAFKGANDGLWDWNLKTNEFYLSPRWKSMLGYSDEELPSSYDSWKRLLHPDDVKPALTLMDDFLGNRVPKYEAEFRLRHKEGHYVNILSRAFLLFGDQGEALRMVGTHVDITERKKLEEQLRHAQKMEAVGQLAGGVAHDFNNILSAIFGYAHLIRGEVRETQPVKHYIEEIISASNRAAALTQSLLAFSRKQPMTLAVIDLSEIVSAFQAFLLRLIKEDVELKIVCCADPLPGMVDRGQIEQVIMNLVANARDAMPHGGKLVIKTGPVMIDAEFIEAHGYGEVGEYALITVSDDGVGMDARTASRIFEPFFTTKEQGKGTGLGLSMAYGIVKKHDGFINVYSEPGNGTVFNIYLPLRAAAKTGGKEASETAAPSLEGTETILLGEDDEALRKLSVRILDHYGYRVIEAVDGQDAVDKFIEFQDSVDLVVLDAIMPKKNGREACEEMSSQRPDMKFVFVSGYASDIFKERQPHDDRSTFIQKPVSPTVLVAKVREMLDRLRAE